MEIPELKRKLRRLKKLEAKIRFKNSSLQQNGQFIWNKFFSTNDVQNVSVKYNMQTLSGMNHQKQKEVFDEYFYHVFFQYYKENGLSAKVTYDIELLSSLGLPPDSSIESIKSRFRELAKKYHPDVGGDSMKFIELVDTYKKLIADE